MNPASFFHPAVADWFNRSFPAPTPAQAEAWPAIRSGFSVATGAQGLAEPQYNHGFIYGTGRGGPQNDTEAIKWYRLAAQQGLSAAQFNLVMN